MSEQSKQKNLLAEKIISWYISAWADKNDRGIFDLWEKIDTYWEGTAHSFNHGDDINSNVNIIHPTVEGQVAILANREVSITCRAVTPSEKDYVKKAETILNFVKAKNDLFSVIDSHERRRVKFGTGVLRVIYDPSALGGMPVIESVNPAYIFPDPKISDPAKINEGEFVIETMRKPISWARKYYGNDMANKIEANYDPTGSIQCYPERSVGADGNPPAWFVRFAGRLPSSPTKYINETENTSYLHILCWFRTNGKLRLVECTGCGVILYDSFDKLGEEAFYPTNKYPYFFTPLYRREGSVWAKGDAELLIPLQDLIDELDDQIRNNAKLSGNPQRLVDVSCNIDLDKWTNESGLIIPTANIDGAKFLTPPEMPDYPLKRREQALNYERQMVSRFADQMAGTTNSGTQTATEIQALVSQGGINLDYKKKLLQNTLSQVFEYCYALITAFESKKKSYKTSDGFVWLSGDDFKNIPLIDEEGIADSIKEVAEFDIEVEIN